MILIVFCHKKSGWKSVLFPFETYQAERLQLRYRTKDGQKQNVHTSTEAPTLRVC